MYRKDLLRKDYIFELISISESYIMILILNIQAKITKIHQSILLSNFYR